MIHRRDWVKEESGFQVFEFSALSVAGLIVALLVGSYILWNTFAQYTVIENEFIGGEKEASETLERFR